MFVRIKYALFGEQNDVNGNVLLCPCTLHIRKIAFQMAALLFRVWFIGKNRCVIINDERKGRKLQPIQVANALIPGVPIFAKIGGKLKCGGGFPKEVGIRFAALSTDIRCITALCMAMPVKLGVYIVF